MIKKEWFQMKQALLIVDVQNDYFPGGRSELHHPMAALSKIEKLLGHFRAKGMPVIHVQHINLREGATFFRPHTHGALIHERLTPQAGERLVVKHAPNSFHETNLLAILREEGITDLVICGMMSHMCVDTTARACKDFGIGVTLIDDACATKDLAWEGRPIPAETVHRVFMAALNGMFATVQKAEDFLSI
jgi:nicotinamidase-related amidase